MPLELHGKKQKSSMHLFVPEKSSYQASLCPNIPVQEFSQKDHMSQFQTFMLLQLHRENQKNSKH